jgi:hypothetical protein
MRMTSRCERTFAAHFPKQHCSACVLPRSHSGIRVLSWYFVVCVISVLSWYFLYVLLACDHRVLIVVSKSYHGL